MKNQTIVFTRINQAELLESERPIPSDHEILVRTEFSTISCGTEKANLTGDPNVSTVKNAEVKFPRFSGYSSSGTVIGKGKSVTDFEIGDRVAMFWSQHKKYNCLPASRAVKIGSQLSMQAAALFHIATFPLAAIRKTRLEIGESMMVMGLGILGLFAVRLAHAAGATPVIAVDPVPKRREKALAFGADYALDPFEEGFAEKVKALTEGGVKTAIEVTGLGAGLNQTLDCMAKFGRVALLGCTRDSDFTVDYYRKVHGPGIQLIGAHTMARPSCESAPGYFTAEDDMKTLIKLCALGRIRFDDMIDRVCSPADCTEVYSELINDRHFPTVVQFDWRKV